MYKIGRLAELAECQPVTIRYYEKEGLLGKPARGDNGYRWYGPDDLERLRFIRHCRDHGITLADVKMLLKLREAPEGDCEPVDALIDEIILKLEEQLKSIRKLKKNLVTLKGRCRGGSIAECAILKGLSDRGHCPCSVIQS
jgi:DNA-binding transcriptional MerR regulator